MECTIKLLIAHFGISFQIFCFENFFHDIPTQNCGNVKNTFPGNESALRMLE